MSTGPKYRVCLTAPAPLLALILAAGQLQAQPPTLVLDILPGSASSDPFWFADVDGTLIFTADDATHGREPWKSNGTAPGTVLVRDTIPGPDGGAWALAGASTIAYFTEPGSELWKTDGTEGGTVLVTTFADGGTPLDLTAVGDEVFFSKDTAGLGVELWASDGTEPGTRLVKDLAPGPPGSFPFGLVPFLGQLFFGADNDAFEPVLWASDGTEPGTRVVAAVLPHDITPVGGVSYFGGNVAGAGTELWKTDGTTAGTVQIKDIWAGGSSDPWNFTATGDAVFFWALGSLDEGRELWKTDGTEAGTVLVKDINPGNQGSVPFVSGDFVALGDRLVFAADDGVHGGELWVSDGTEAGTTMLKDIFPGDIGSLPLWLTVIGERVYFSAHTPTQGTELWTTDGTAEGTVLVADIRPGPDSSGAERLTLSGGQIYFRADDGVRGLELWVLDRRAVFSDGFESGDTSAWSSTVP